MATGNNIGNTYTYRIGNRTYTVNPAAQGGYMDAYNQYAADRKAQFDQTTANLDQTLAQNNATTNANYDNSARQAYVDYMRNQRALPSQLQALGVRGGATESGLLNLYNNYGTEHAANEQQRNADLTSNQQARDDAYNQAQQAYQTDLSEQKQQAITNQMNEYNNEITRFSSSVAQYPTTEAGYKAYENWIKNLAASNDPLKDIKIGLVRQQMATQFPNGSPESQSSGSGGGGGSSRSYGRGRGSSRSSGGGGGNSGNTGTGVRHNDYYRSRAAQTGRTPTTSNRGRGNSSRANSKSVSGGRYYTNRRNLGRGGIW